MQELDEIDEDGTGSFLTNDPEEVKKWLRTWQETFKNIEFPSRLNFVDEFSRFGLLGEFYTAIRCNEQVDLRSVRREITLQNLIGTISDEITKNASFC